MNTTTRTLALTLAAIAGTATIGTATAAATPNCTGRAALNTITIDIHDGTYTATFIPTAGCDNTAVTIAAHDTAHLTWDPTEVQPLIASMTVPASAGRLEWTLPAGVAPRCRLQLDLVTGRAFVRAEALRNVGRAADGDVVGLAFLAGGGEFPRHAGDEIADESLVHPDLAVGEELDQDAAQKDIVGGAQLRRGRRLEPGQEVRQSYPPARRRRQRRDQHIGLLLAGEIEQMEESRLVQPNKKRFTVRRIIGSGDLWVTEFVLSYDGIPSYAVSIMEFREGLVANETQYFAGRFEPAPSRAHLVERVGEITKETFSPHRS